MPELPKLKTKITNTRQIINPAKFLNYCYAFGFLSTNKMRTEGKISKVAICEKCQGFILACHVDYLDKKIEKKFTNLSNDGFTIKTETGDETRARNYTSSKKCLEGSCSQADA